MALKDNIILGTGSAVFEGITIPLENSSFNIIPIKKEFLKSDGTKEVYIKGYRYSFKLRTQINMESNTTTLLTSIITAINAKLSQNNLISPYNLILHSSESTIFQCWLKSIKLGKIAIRNKTGQYLEIELVSRDITNRLFVFSTAIDGYGTDYGNDYGE